MHEDKTLIVDSSDSMSFAYDKRAEMSLYRRTINYSTAIVYSYVVYHMYESKEKSLAAILMENDGAKDRCCHGGCCKKDFCNSNNSTTKN